MVEEAHAQHLEQACARDITENTEHTEMSGILRYGACFRLATSLNEREAAGLQRTRSCQTDGANLPAFVLHEAGLSSHSGSPRPNAAGFP